MNTQLLRQQVVRVVFSLSRESLLELWSTVQALRDRTPDEAKLPETLEIQAQEHGEPGLAQNALLRLRQIGQRQVEVDAVALVRVGRDDLEGRGIF